jgi:hypothetical protein
MKIAAVATISFLDNELKQMMLEMDDEATWKDTYIEALESGLNDDGKNKDHCDWVMSLDDDLSVARQELINAEMDVMVTFVSVS